MQKREKKLITPNFHDHRRPCDNLWAEDYDKKSVTFPAEVYSRECNFPYQKCDHDKSSNDINWCIIVTDNFKNIQL